MTDTLNRILRITTASGDTPQEMRSNLHSQKLAIAKECTVHCVQCSQCFTLGSADFVQDHFYSGPLPTSTRGRWHPSEPQTCSLRCPHCAQLNYIYTHPESQLIIVLVVHLGFTITEIFKSILDRKGDMITPRPSTMSPEYAK
ncbi:MAG TPA: hypothetical protein VJ579_02060 [Candidatus Paceibacterota bacterium]|nr:hypothetical protein [Candidatus Paceibacterota bacterium]